MDAFETATRRSFFAFEFRQDTAAARRYFEDALRRYAPMTLPPVDRPYQQLAAYHLELGDEAGVRRVISDYRKAVPSSNGQLGDWALGFEAELALRQHRATPRDVALLEARVDSGVCRQCEQMWLGRAYDLAGMGDSALAKYERAVP
jgi:tetratricopeptide (TPR) repeat protein